MRIVYAREFVKEFKKLPTASSVFTASRKISSRKTGGIPGLRLRS
jgi:hypothetical protein